MKQDTIWIRSDNFSAASRWKPSLKQLFVITLSALLMGLGVLFLLIFEGSQQSIMQSAATLREQASSDVAARIEVHLAKAESVANDLEDQFRTGSLNAIDVHDVEKALYARLRHESQLSEVTLTVAQLNDHSEDGIPIFSNEGRWQISYLRDKSKLISRRVQIEEGRFVMDERELPEKRSMESLYQRRHINVSDPTTHPTFQSPASAELMGKPLWSDLHWSELDAQLSPANRRVAVSLQKSMKDADGRFVGVVRVGLLADQLDTLTQARRVMNGESDPHRIFLCDRKGRLVSRWRPDDKFEESDDDVRIHSASAPPEVLEALRRKELSRTEVRSSARFEVNGEFYLASYHALDRSQEWIVGIVVPESAYLQNLTAARNRLLLASLMLMVFIVAGGLWTIRIIRRDLGLALRQTERISAFDFTPARIPAQVTDIDAILAGLERSKTAMRAMQKYVPSSVVRQLHEAHAEPVLGSELRELTLMFTDLKDFTTIAETLPPNELALILGDYLAAMTQAIHSAHGTVDKFIGDAVMAFWNAPLSDAAHSLNACEAALRCVEATRNLFASTKWAGRPVLHTRFGIHRSKVLVGHFGAPDRLNYTAIGDGVNAAARLEGLNKIYGSSILVSDEVYQHACKVFQFRLLDEVAVKGKSHSLKVYELLGRANEKIAHAAEVQNYAAAFDLYRRREFSKSLDLLKKNSSDSPSRVLASRCEEYLLKAPEAIWNGVFYASTK